MRIAKLEDIIANTTNPSHKQDADVYDQIRDLQQQIEQLKLDGNGAEVVQERQCTAVLGGLQKLDSKSDAEAWVKNKLNKLDGPRFVETYTKGDFRGILFVKFETQVQRNSAVRLLKNAGLNEGGKDVWAKPDQILHARLMSKFAHGMSYIIKKWGVDARCIWADPDEGKVYIYEKTDGPSRDANKKLAISASIIDSKLFITYGNLPAWFSEITQSQTVQAYFENENYPEFQDLVISLNDKLANVSKGGGKNARKMYSKQSR